MAEAKTTVTVRQFDASVPAVHEADTVTIEEGRLHLESPTGLVAVYAPGAWASATRAVGPANVQPAVGELPADRNDVTP